MPDIIWHHHQVDKAQRRKLLRQKPRLLWFTGLSGSGKSTLAGALESVLHQKGFATYLLDGDNVRHGLCADLGFSQTDRDENMRRVTEVSKLMLDAGVIVLAAFVSPSRQQRERIRGRFNEHEFIEIYVATPLAVCERRDPKGLYRKARAGEIKGFTGIDAEYEPPAAAELTINTDEGDLGRQVGAILEYLLALDEAPAA